MEVKLILLVTIAANVVNIQANSETLLTFNIKGGSGSFQPSAADVEDKDGNRVEPTVTDASDNVVIRTATMPSWLALDLSTIHENNYVYLPFIANPTNNKMVVLRYSYNHVKTCAAQNYPPGPVQCNDYLMLYLVPVSSISVDMTTVDVIRTNIGSFNLSSTTGDVNKEHIITIPPSVTGYRLVLHDGGSQFLVKSLTLTRYYCKYTAAVRKLPIVCTDTAASQTPEATQCHCGDLNSEPNNTRATIEHGCVYDSATHTALFSRAIKDRNVECKCSGNFIRAKFRNDTRYCKAKPVVIPPTAARLSSTTRVPAARLSSTTRVPAARSSQAPVVMPSVSLTAKNSPTPTSGGSVATGSSATPGGSVGVISKTKGATSTKSALNERATTVNSPTTTCAASTSAVSRPLLVVPIIGLLSSG